MRTHCYEPIKLRAGMPHDGTKGSCPYCGGLTYHEFADNQTTCTNKWCKLNEHRLTTIDRILGFLKR